MKTYVYIDQFHHVKGYDGTLDYMLFPDMEDKNAVADFKRRVQKLMLDNHGQKVSVEVSSYNDAIATLRLSGIYEGGEDKTSIVTLFLADEKLMAELTNPHTP